MDRYAAMRDALNRTGRPIYYSICDWGVAESWLWGRQVCLGGGGGCRPCLQSCRAARAAGAGAREPLPRPPRPPPRPAQVGNSWRTTRDIEPSWLSMLHNLDNSVGLARYAGPGGWNDPDMLEVGSAWGRVGWGEGGAGGKAGGLAPAPARAELPERARAPMPPTPHPASPPSLQVGVVPASGGGLKPQEERAHFALWALLKAPLIIGADLRHISNSSLAVLKAREVIAVNQDDLGVAGDLVWKEGAKEVRAGAECSAASPR